MTGAEHRSHKPKEPHRDTWRAVRTWEGMVGGVLLLSGLIFLAAHGSVHHYTVQLFDRYIWWDHDIEPWRQDKLYDLVGYCGVAGLVVGGVVLVAAYAAPEVLHKIFRIALATMTTEDESSDCRLSWPAIGVLFGSISFAYMLIRLSGVRWLLYEDGLTEYITASAYLAGAILGLLATYRLRSLGYRWVVVTYVVMALVFFIVAMEEISWGQRLLGIETPQLIGDNEQGEFNLHNLAIWNHYLDSLFIPISAIGISGVFLAIGLKLLGRSSAAAALLLPQPWLIFPLTIILVYSIVPGHVLDFSQYTIGETRETLTAVCALLYTARKFRRSGSFLVS